MVHRLERHRHALAQHQRGQVAVHVIEVGQQQEGFAPEGLQPTGGVVGLVDSMAIGFRALAIATDAQVAGDPDLDYDAAGGRGMSGGVWARSASISMRVSG